MSPTLRRACALLLAALAASPAVAQPDEDVVMGVRPDTGEERRMFVPQPRPDEPGFYDVAEFQPELIGGMAGIAQHVVYPDDAREAGVEGMAVVWLVVDEAGVPRDARPLRAPTESMGEAAVQAAQALRFVPGLVDGVAVRTRFLIPVRFHLAPEDVTPVIAARRRLVLDGIEFRDLANGPHAERMHVETLALLDGREVEAGTTVVRFTLLPDGATADVETAEGASDGVLEGLARGFVGMMRYSEAQRPRIPVRGLRVRVTYRTPE